MLENIFPIALFALSVSVQIARAHFWLGSFCEKQGRQADAKASYAASLKINPNQKDADEALKRVW